MEIFISLVINLLPLYVLIGAGFIVGRYVGLDSRTMANLVLYLCIPVVAFGFVADLELKPAYALLPVITFLIQFVIGYVMFRVGKSVYGDARANLLAMCTAMGNSGYFGLPLVLLLFEDRWVGVYMFMLLGFLLYEATVGYYIAARGKFTARESLLKVLKFPSVYAISAGLLINFMDIPLPDLFKTYWTYCKGAYVILGMLIIGVALSKLQRLVLAPRFLSMVMLGKFIIWPLMAYGFILADRAYLHMFEEPVLMLIMVVSLVPPAANIAAFSAQFDIVPEKAATTIMLTTVFALFYIPAILVLTGMH
jgi:predicted permease